MTVGTTDNMPYMAGIAVKLFSMNLVRDTRVYCSMAFPALSIHGAWLSHRFVFNAITMHFTCGVAIHTLHTFNPMDILLIVILINLEDGSYTFVAAQTCILFPGNHS
jgi:hypothetical protein